MIPRRSKYANTIRPRHTSARVLPTHVLCCGLSLAFSSMASAQTAHPLPYTQSTLAGAQPMTAAAGTQCPNLPTGVKSTTAFGDGCLATNAVFGSQARGGVQVDSFGNVFVADDINSIVHTIDPNSGLLSVLAGGASSVCAAATGTGAAGAVDTSGDGCLAATQTKTPSQRGIGIDPYGNVLLAGYGDNALHVVCRTASPTCSTAQIGTMQLVAGCVKSATSAPTGGVGLDNVKAAQTFVSAGCTPSNGELSAPRGVIGDVYGNIYFADTSSSRTRVVLGPLTSTYFSGTNPLYAALSVVYATPTAGYAYSVVNVSGTSTTTGGTATTKGATCSVTTNGTTYTGTALDTLGDGCPFNSSSVLASSGFTSGVAADAAGNLLFSDPTHGLRVVFVSGAGTAGARMQAAITANNPGVTPQPGFVYLLWGGGSTALGATPTLGTSTAASDSTLTKLAVGPDGNVYLGSNNRVILFDLSTGYVHQLFAGSANVTAGNYCSGSSGPKSLSAYSDGCPAPNSLFSNASGLGLSLDAANNLYLFDASSTSKMLVRKVLAQGFVPETLNSAQVQTFAVHLPALGSGTAALSATAEMTATAATCAGPFADNSLDCTSTVTTTPVAPGQRSASLLFTAGTSAVNIALGGVATGSELAFDAGSVTAGGTSTPIATISVNVFPGTQPNAPAADGAGNLYAYDARSSRLLESIRGTTYSINASLASAPTSIAADAAGDVYLASSNGLTELTVTGAPAAAGQPPQFTPVAVTYTPGSGSVRPQAVALDAAGNVFVADKQSTTSATAIYRLSALRGSPQSQVTLATGFSNPVALAVDAAGNVFVADRDAAAVYKLTPVSGTAASYTQSTVAGLSGVVPVGLATDAAGDLYVQDAAHNNVVEVPVSGAVTVVATDIAQPSGLAVDGGGTVYSADLGSGAVQAVTRTAQSFYFGTNQSQTFSGTVTDIGNQLSTGQNPATGSANFVLSGGSASPCNLSSGALGAQAAGNACTLTASFVGAGSGAVTDQITYLPAATTTGSLTLSGTLTGSAMATTTTIGSPSPANPSYTPSGTEVTFTVTVASAQSAPTGNVTVTIDGGTPAYYPLTNGVASIALSGLTAGTHTIYAAYPTSGSFSASNSGSPVSFTIAQDAVSLAWQPAVTALAFSAPVGNAVLNATATYNGATVPGTFVYTAGGAEIHAASYLPIGTYALQAKFVPADATDYAGGTIPGGTLTVSRAATTAALGSTSMVVAADGTGNYTSVQSAVNALPTTGGSIYLKPGTYNGFVTVANPNVSFYGLGGDPTRVVLTNGQGAFSPPFLAGQGYGNNGSAGDQGSATLVVARGTVNGTTGTPSNFYAENLTVANTYDTDTTTTSTNALVGGTCTANQPAQTLANLYNAGTLCNSQALAVWITSDQAVLNNVYTTSQQDTIYAGAISGSGGYAARQYWFRGKVTGDVDYIFGDAAAVFDHSSIYTTYHGSVTGTTTIEAQNKATQTGNSPDYLSGYVMNSDVFTSQSAGMTNLYFGRPYGKYSTWIMLNSLIDQVNPLGYSEFQGLTNLPTSTYAEYNNGLYTDPATGTPDANGVVYLGSGGSSGAGVTGTRETVSQDPGTPAAANAVKTSLTQAEAQPYYPLAFLSQTVPVSPYNSVTNWDPTAALATAANRFASTGSGTTITAGSPITVLMRPQTPGLGAVTNGNYTIPTGTYTLTDTLNGSATTLAAGTLDAAGEASVSTAALPPGTHNLAWSYGGDANFAPSTSGTYTVTVTGSLSNAQLITTGGVSRQADGSYNFVLTVTNPGSTAVSGVTISSATLGSASGTPLPQTVGSIAAGASASITVNVPASAGASGSRVAGKVMGSYTGGSFGSSLRITLP